MPKILLDYGHGGSDPGAIGNGHKEKDLTLQIGKKLRKELTNQGFDVIESRGADTTVTLDERRKVAITHKVDQVVSIHINSFLEKSANGYETWIRKLATNRENQLSVAIHNRIVKAKLFGSNRGIKKEDFAMLTLPNIPSVLLELGFISNVNDVNVIVNKQDEIVKAICKGICDYWGKDYKEVKSDQNFYRVQVGAFSNKKNAELLQGQLKKLGYDSIII